MGGKKTNSLAGSAHTSLLCKSQLQETGEMSSEESPRSRLHEADRCLESCPRKRVFLLFL